jgi:hypothetical protein
VDPHGPFSDGWRVTPEESLLPYAPGEDTTTHTDRTFPDAPATVDTLTAERRAAALEACTRAGVTAQPWLDSCVLDVGLTGQPAFARSLADSEAALTVTAQPAPAATAGQFTIRDGAGVGPDRPGPGAGRLEPGRKHRFALDIGAAPAVWLHPLEQELRGDDAASRPGRRPHRRPAHRVRAPSGLLADPARDPAWPVCPGGRGYCRHPDRLRLRPARGHRA